MENKIQFDSAPNDTVQQIIDKEMPKKSTGAYIYKGLNRKKKHITIIDHTQKNDKQLLPRLNETYPVQELKNFTDKTFKNFETLLPSLNNKCINLSNLFLPDIQGDIKNLTDITRDNTTNPNVLCAYTVQKTLNAAIKYISIIIASAKKDQVNFDALNNVIDKGFILECSYGIYLNDGVNINHTIDFAKIFHSHNNDKIFLIKKDNLKHYFSGEYIVKLQDKQKINNDNVELSSNEVNFYMLRLIENILFLIKNIKCFESNPSSATHLSLFQYKAKYNDAIKEMLQRKGPDNKIRISKKNWGKASKINNNDIDYKTDIELRENAAYIVKSLISLITMFFNTMQLQLKK